MTFAYRLRELRKMNNLTQEDLSVKLNISAGAVGLYEQGRRTPDNETLIALSKIFDVSVDYLLGLNDVDYFHSTLKYSGDDNEEKDEIVNLINQILNNINDESKLQQIKMFLETYIEK